MPICYEASTNVCVLKKGEGIRVSPDSPSTQNGTVMGTVSVCLSGPSSHVASHVQHTWLAGTPWVMFTTCDRGSAEDHTHHV